MPQDTTQPDQAKIKEIAALLGASPTGRAVLDGLTDARLGTLGDRLGEIVTAITAAREDVRALKDDWRSGGRNKAQLGELAETLGASNETVLEASRRLRIMTMGLREGGIDERICTLIDQQVTHVLIACEGNEYSADELGRMAGMLGALEGSVSRLSGAQPPLAPRPAAARAS
jgi:hypothetical protein